MNFNITQRSDAGLRHSSQEAGTPLAPDNQKTSWSFPTDPAISLVLSRYWGAIRRHALKIAIFVAATLLFTGAILLRLPKKYESTCVIRLDPSVPVSVVSNQPGGGQDSDVLFATATKEITTPAVVTPIVEKLGLWAPPGDNSSTDVPPSFVAGITRNIKTSQEPGTYLLNVSYRSSSPDQAAAVANALAEQFIEHEYDTRNSALVSLTQYMREQIKELGQRMKESQVALDAFERENNIINPDSTSSLMNQQLSSLQQDLGQEQAKQRTLEANLALAKEGTLDALLVSDRGDSLAALIQAQQQSQLQLDVLSSKYGPGNYLFQQKQRELAHINSSVEKAQQHILAQISAQARAQAVQVRLTERQLADAKGQLEEFNRKNVQFQILKHQADTDQLIYSDLLQRVDAADVSAGYHSTALRIIDAATPNPSPVYPRTKETLILALLLSGMLGVVGAVTADGLDQTLRDPRAVPSELGTGLLGSLPEVRNGTEIKSLLMPASVTESQDANADGTPFAESLLGIRSTLLLGASGSPMRALAVISSRPEEGKTTVAMTLAMSMAALGRRTVLVDGDLRRPQVHRVLDISNRLGLSSILQDHATLEEAVVPGGIDRLSILPAGPLSINAREHIAARIGEVIEELKTRFEIVVIDTPPMLGFADGLNVASVADASLLVVRAGRTSRDCVQMVIDQLRQVRAQLAGIVLNGVTPEMSHHYYYYHDGYHSYRAHRNGNDGDDDA
ncbi:MAG TPA: polysaccharide biosynthesis tyrosine autokinase [Terriglobia bacterium]|nr:polysaccharide biosynthesis tyrosine autokinase [Terriglobia bacterium]